MSGEDIQMLLDSQLGAGHDFAGESTPSRSSASKPLRARPTLYDLLDIDNCYPVFFRICSMLPIRDIIALTRTCKTFSALYQRLLPIQWNVDHHLYHFVNAPRAFRAALGRFDGLISGSFALQFLDRCRWPESDLDIFVNGKKELVGGGADHGLGTYLMAHESYERVEHGERDPDVYKDLSDITSIRTYLKRRNSGQPAKIQVITTENLPLQVILRGFYTTCVVNIISWNRAYAVFPDCTFIDRISYLLHPLTGYYARLIHKYRNRGWKVQPKIWSDKDRESTSLRSDRRIGDRCSWVIPLNTDGIQRPATPDSVLEFSFFSISTRSVSAEEYSQRDIDPWANCYEIAAPGLSSHVLRYRYTLGRSSGLLTFLAERLVPLTKMELAFLKEEDRPPTYKRMFEHPERAHYRSFPHPPYWHYHDDEYPAWCAAYAEEEIISPTR